MNPITQRSTTTSQQNGVGPQVKTNANKAATNQEVNMEGLAHERLVYLLANFMVSERNEIRHFEFLIRFMLTGSYCYCNIEER